MIKKGIIFVGAFSFTMFLTTILENQTYASTLNTIKTVNWSGDNNQNQLDKELINSKTSFTERKYSDTYSINQGDTIKSILRKSQIDPIDINNFMYKTKDADKFFNLKTGQEVTVERDQNNALSKLLVNNGTAYILQAKKKQTGEFEISEKERDYKIVRRYVAGKIDTSLIESAKKVGLSTAQVNQLTNIFTWDIDFKYDIKQGDTFSAVFEQKVLDNKIIGTGDIIGAEFVVSGKKFTAYLNEEKGVKKYYAEDGSSLQKAFLRNPIEVAKVSSQFNNGRLHPIFKKIKAHMGTDYAAAPGTPINTTGDGVVEFVGKQSGYGNVVIIDHGRGYSTLYAHMKGFKKGLSQGMKVSQGDILGFVGSTGYATGPHLHYEFKINGIAQNSLTVDLPTSQSLPKVAMVKFNKEVATIAMNMKLIKGDIIQTDGHVVALVNNTGKFE